MEAPSAVLGPEAGVGAEVAEVAEQLFVSPAPQRRKEEQKTK